MKNRINDKLLIRALIRNARIPNVALAKLFKVSEAAIRKRIEKLEASGVVLGYKALIDPVRAGMAISLTGIDVKPEKLVEVYEKLKGFKEVEVIYITSGDHNLIVEVVCNSMDELMEVHKKIENFEGVVRICPAMLTNVWRRGLK